MATKAKIYIDGQAGTTGLEITQRLQARDDLELLYLDDTNRKDPTARQAQLQAADISILCLDDEIARQAVELAAGQCRLLDASTAHRVDPQWAYGLPELCSSQRALIKESMQVSNPGCYPQGFILLIRPLIEAGLLSPTVALRCHAVSGYSGGGRKMIEAHQAFNSAEAEALNSQVYALGLAHKHVPEMQTYSLTATRPLFTPTVANYYRGMLVQIPLFIEELNGTDRATVHSCLHNTYQHEAFIDVLPLSNDGYVNPTACNGSNRIELMVFGNDQQILLAARYDNLGKGAAGAAVQNLNLMLGIGEDTSL